MDSSAKGQAAGTLHQLKGKIKEVAGMISDSPKLRPQGAAERTAGNFYQKIGQYNQFWGK